MTVIKRDRGTTKLDLITAIEKLCPLLLGQGEEDAVQDLIDAAAKLKKAADPSKEAADAIEKIIDAFEGDHELMAYTLTRDTQEWTEAEELSQASSRVLSLARRMHKTK